MSVVLSRALSEWKTGFTMYLFSYSYLKYIEKSMLSQQERDVYSSGDFQGVAGMMPLVKQ